MPRANTMSSWRIEEDLSVSPCHVRICQCKQNHQTGSQGLVEIQNSNCLCAHKSLTSLGLNHFPDLKLKRKRKVRVIQRSLPSPAMMCLPRVNLNKTIWDVADRRLFSSEGASAGTQLHSAITGKTKTGLRSSV